MALRRGSYEEREVDERMIACGYRLLAHCMYACPPPTVHFHGLSRACWDSRLTMNPFSVVATNVSASSATPVLPHGSASCVVARTFTKLRPGCRLTAFSASGELRYT